MAGCDGGQQPLHEATSFRRLAANAELAQADRRTQGPITGVVRELVGLVAEVHRQSVADCSRFLASAMSPAELQSAFDLFREPDWSPRYNLGPMQQALAVRLKSDGMRLAEPLQWGLVPGWAKDPKSGSQLVNARGETVASKPSFRDAFKRRRCLILAAAIE